MKPAILIHTNTGVPNPWAAAHYWAALIHNQTAQGAGACRTNLRKSNYAYVHVYAGLPLTQASSPLTPSGGPPSCKRWGPLY